MTQRIIARLDPLQAQQTKLRDQAAAVKQMQDYQEQIIKAQGVIENQQNPAKPVTTTPMKR